MECATDKNFSVLQAIKCLAILEWFRCQINMKGNAVVVLVEKTRGRGRNKYGYIANLFILC